MSELACRICRRLVRGNFCPVCKSQDLTKNWKGVLIVFDANSEIARAAGITAPGKYAVRVK